MATLHKIYPCLWFDDQAEEAAKFYVSIFDHSRITRVTKYGKAGHDIHKQPAGRVLTVDFELDGAKFTGLNGGPLFTFNEAISIQVMCETQAEIDRYWTKLGEGGDPKAQQCGWLKDKFGLSWQIAPAMLADLIHDETSEKGQRAFEAMMGMKKLDIAALKKAYEGG